MINLIHFNFLPCWNDTFCDSSEHWAVIYALNWWQSCLLYVRGNCPNWSPAKRRGVHGWVLHQGSINLPAKLWSDRRKNYIRVIGQAYFNFLMLMLYEIFSNWHQVGSLARRNEFEKILYHSYIWRYWWKFAQWRKYNFFSIQILELRKRALLLTTAVKLPKSKVTVFTLLLFPDMVQRRGIWRTFLFGWAFVTKSMTRTTMASSFI